MTDPKTLELATEVLGYCKGHTQGPIGIKQTKEKLAALESRHAFTVAESGLRLIEVAQLSDKLAASEKTSAEWRLELSDWQDYWGCESPHDSHVMAENSNPYSRQLGKEQARANAALHELAACEITLAAMREAVEKEECSGTCATKAYRIGREDEEEFVPINGSCNCIKSRIKSRIPAGPDSPLVEAVRRVIAAWTSTSFVISDIPDEALASIDQMIALAPESWKQPEVLPERL